MIQSIDSIARQARQGSIAAIIQILNDKLADAGVRTRAMLDGSVLQLLCEAASPDQLEQKSLVERIRYLLESIGPHNIHRVNINSRIAREQQLLWLDEIQRDPEHQLLWSQEIRLKRPNPMKRWWEDRQFARMEQAIAPLPKSESKHQQASRHFWRGILVGGSSLGLLILLVGWAVSDWLGLPMPELFFQTASNGREEEVSASPEPVAAPVSTATSEPDPFVAAVRIAEQAAGDGQTATTPAEWLDLASRWQRASELMAQVPADDSRYATAQDRTQVYSQNSQAAQQKAEALRDAASN